MHTHTHTHTLTQTCTHTHTLSAVPIGRIDYPTTDVIENITLGMETIATIVPRGWQNIQSVHLKTPDSIALPIFNSAPPDASLLPGVEAGLAGGRKRKIAHLEQPEDEGW